MAIQVVAGKESSNHLPLSYKLFLGLVFLVIATLVTVRPHVYNSFTLPQYDSYSPQANASLSHSSDVSLPTVVKSVNVSSTQTRGSNVTNYVLAITQAGDYLLTDWPIPNLLENDFTMELWYKTPPQSKTSRVALISNLRHAQNAEQYGRDFGIYVDDGKILVEFHGYQPTQRIFERGRIETHQRIDNDQWHFIRLVRNGQQTNGQLTLYLNGDMAGQTVMPIHYDYESQEQRAVIGGGNDKAFRPCQMDNIRIWNRALETSSRSSREDPNLIMHLSFDDPTEGVMIHDCAWHGNGAIRMGTTLRTQSAFVVATLPDTAVPPSTHCSSWPGVNNKKPIAKPNQDTTLLLTYLGVDCAHKGVWFVKGGLYELEAYVGALWMDANRLGMPLHILTECVDLHFRNLFTTPYVTFQEVKDVLVDTNTFQSNATQTTDQYSFHVPKVCHQNRGGLAYMKRFLVLDQMLSQGRFRKEYDYVVHIDLRDSRAMYWPDWRKDAEENLPKSRSTASPPWQLWLQSIRSAHVWVCGGFQAGNYDGMARLMHVVAQKILAQQCDMKGQNDQQLLIKAYSRKEFASDVRLDGGIVNSQLTRRFDGIAFSHGNWWMSVNKIKDPHAKKAYPQDVPYHPS